ncbi:MAG: carboxypeptidase-like regulatory domain-containing protein, partial [Deltaproteobacteria bacterium]|nr:carboxypeptidase-like regulatory domain-containing protein [Deltaproteobacteria bacterium]
IVGQQSLKTKTDANGLFVIHDIPAGDYIIDAKSNGQKANIKMTISAGKTAVCSIVLVPGNPGTKQS